MSAMDPRADEVNARLDELDNARRRVERSVAASGIAMRRVLRASDGEPTRLAGDGPSRFEEGESWPRRTRGNGGVRLKPGPTGRRGTRLYKRAAVVLLMLVLVGVAARWLQSNTVASGFSRTQAAPVVSTSVASTSVVSGFSRTAAAETFVVSVHATRRCLVRIVVDGTVLDWRELKAGDEFVSRPAHDILIETDDAGALAATVNGESVRLGADGQNVVFRLPPHR